MHGAALSYQLRSRADTDWTSRWLRHGGPRQRLALHERLAAAVRAGDAGTVREAVRRRPETMPGHLAQAGSLSRAR